MKYMKDFRELFSWDFTQFSCFNESDTMLLVSIVKTTDYLDRRGYMAIMSLIHGKYIHFDKRISFFKSVHIFLIP